LSDSERQILDRVIAEHGHKDRWGLVGETHRFPEYERVYQQDTCTLIPYELILEIYGQDDEDRFRDGRPVVRPQTAERMKSPFARSEPDL
jgi:hypothetical protein